ncbi:spore wall protein 2-like, partial [Hyalella azteca]
MSLRNYVAELVIELKRKPCEEFCEFDFVEDDSPSQDVNIVDDLTSGLHHPNRDDVHRHVTTLVVHLPAYRDEARSHVTTMVARRSSYRDEVTTNSLSYSDYEAHDELFDENAMNVDTFFHGDRASVEDGGESVVVEDGGESDDGEDGEESDDVEEGEESDDEEDGEESDDVEDGEESDDVEDGEESDDGEDGEESDDEEDGEDTVDGKYGEDTVDAVDNARRHAMFKRKSTRDLLPT